MRRTQDSFGRRRAATLMIAKFVPGLATLAPPVAGENGMGFGRFLFFDGIGSALWVGALLAAGRFFGDLLKRNTQRARLGRPLLRLCCSSWASSASLWPGFGAVASF